MTETILFVDDEVNVLDSMRRQLRNRFSIDTAASGAEALAKFKSHGPFAVIVSDMRMPKMDGIKLLSLIKEMYPETVRMMLTGNADQETASEAVNKGQIFRFLTKPCSMPTMITSLALALRQHRLVTAERELLDKTLRGSIKVLSDLLGYTSPNAFSSSVRICPIVVKLGRMLAVDNLWQLEIATLMSQIGSVTLPPDILTKHYAGEKLTDTEQALFEQHPHIGAELLQHIPRMEGVALIIRNQLRPCCQYDPGDTDHSDESLCSQIIHTVFDYDLLVSRGLSHELAVRHLADRPDDYDPRISSKLAACKMSGISRLSSLRVRELRVGMIVDENIEAANGTLLAPKGQEITWPVLQGLINFSRQAGVKEPVRVCIKEQTDTMEWEKQ